MAAGLEVPRGIFGHGWLLVGGEKMSKSKLTGIAPEQITETFGSDAFRFYFLSAISFGQDGSFSWEDLAARYQAELANGFGNLASRVVAMVNRYCDGVVPQAAELSAADHEIARSSSGRRMPRGRRSTGSRSRRRSRDLGARRRPERLHHRRGAVGAREGPAPARPPRDRARHGVPRARHARRAALARAARGDREALDRARRRRAPCRSSASTARTSGRSATGSRRSRRCSRASR